MYVAFDENSFRIRFEQTRFWALSPWRARTSGAPRHKWKSNGKEKGHAETKKEAEGKKERKEKKGKKKKIKKREMKDK